MHYNYVILKFAKDTYCLKSRALGHYHAVEDIKYDPSYGRIGSVSRGSVKFWCVGQNGMLSPTLQSPPEEDFIVRSLCFVSGGEEVLLFYLETHEVACYHLSPWDHRWTKSVDSRIGYAALAPTGKDIYTSNLHNGVDRYLLPDLILDRKFHYQIEDNVPLHIATPFDGDLMVIGGDRGIAKVFNMHTGKLVNIISHTKDKSPVQVVNTRSQQPRMYDCDSFRHNQGLVWNI
ncbi:hypothetical protein QCA50_020581 [Cerrena zonata]|uniref:Uncharacterized protein n=1 Tax=Cerrena zonata TaxID=2478898 RepID=A0AAW0F986_9APHY